MCNQAALTKSPKATAEDAASVIALASATAIAEVDVECTACAFHLSTLKEKQPVFCYQHKQPVLRLATRQPAVLAPGRWCDSLDSLVLRAHAIAYDSMHNPTGDNRVCNTHLTVTVAGLPARF